MQTLKKAAAAVMRSRGRACSGGGGGERVTPLRRLLDDAGTFGESERGLEEDRWATQPYVARGAGATTDARTALDPRESTVLLFPGQGSQRVGMGAKLSDVPAARDLYDLASSVVGWDVWRVCTAGPEDELERRCQTCVLVTSLAALERVRDERPAALERVRVVAGFSLGELTALAYAGALSVEAALRVVELRAAAMRAAAAARPQGMLTVWLASDARLDAALRAARQECGDDAVCEVANYLYPGCRVLAGDEAALEVVRRRGAEWGVRRAARVRATGACHTRLMAPAGEALREALASVRLQAPRVRVVSGADGRRYGDGASVARGLVRGVSAPVRWERALQALYARPRGSRFPLTLALGPGGALRATLRHVNARAWDSCLQVEV